MKNARIAGIFGQTSPIAAILGLPIAACELSVGIALTFRGIRKV